MSDMTQFLALTGLFNKQNLGNYSLIAADFSQAIHYLWWIVANVNLNPVLIWEEKHQFGWTLLYNLPVKDPKNLKVFFPFDNYIPDPFLFINNVFFIYLFVFFFFFFDFLIIFSITLSRLHIFKIWHATYLEWFCVSLSLPRSIWIINTGSGDSVNQSELINSCLTQCLVCLQEFR